MDQRPMTIGPGMDLPIMHDGDRYELVRNIGSGNFGVARLMRDKQTDELVAVKYIERGEKCEKKTERLLLVVGSRKCFAFGDEIIFYRVRVVMNWLYGLFAYALTVPPVAFPDEQWLLSAVVKCGSGRSVAPIKAGFVARVGRRNTGT